jgi:sec-independent protein translocase protein TatB
MFGLAWTEIGLIGVVAMVLIGPKDMPIAIKAVADMVKKARRMAGEFQGHVDEMLRESGMEGVRSSISELRSLDIRGQVLRAVDSDGSIRSALTEDPFRHTETSITAPDSGVTMAPLGEATASIVPVDAGAGGDPGAAPAFVPPEYVPPAPPAPPPPAFIPPATVPSSTVPNSTVPVSAQPDR